MFLNYYNIYKYNVYTTSIPVQHVYKNVSLLLRFITVLLKKENIASVRYNITRFGLKFIEIFSYTVLFYNT